ncbi:hypothetical protein ACFLZ1_00345 [Patescibacteria group bacterium]
MLFQLSLPGGISIPEPAGFNFAGGSLADVINEALKYIFPFAGLIMFFLFIAAGFQLLTSAGNPESTKKGYQRLLFAIIGFLVIFLSYWLIQIIGKILGFSILT